MTADTTLQFVRHVRETKFEDIQPAAIVRAKLAVLDIIAVSLVGAGTDIATKARGVAAAWGGKEESRVFFFGNKIPAHNAAFVNAIMSRVMDFDDTFELAPNGAHASAYIIPTAFALADRDRTISGKEFLSAIVIASDLYCRATRAIRANAVDTGRDNGTSVFGTVAAAMRLMRLNEEQCLNAFGIAYAQAAGEFQMYEEASQTVSLQQGMRARSGIDSAEMARAGLNGPHEVFFGRYGFYKAFEPVHDVELLLRDLGKDFVCRELSYKPYPCCKCMHPAIFATLQLREAEQVQSNDIVGIRVGTNRMCRDFLAEPRDLKWNPPTQVAAKFSLPYGVSVAAAKGAVGIIDFEEQSLTNPEVRRLLAVTSVEIDADIERTDGPNQNAPAKVYFRLRDGREISTRVDYPRGHPRNPPTKKEVEDKLRQCAASSSIKLTEKRLADIWAEVDSLPDAKDARRLVDLMMAAYPRHPVD
jgi:2-methylcitrate dehydratase PrpD